MIGGLSVFPEMSRKGVARTWLPSQILILPDCSTINRRPEPSPALRTATGLLSPDAIETSSRSSGGSAFASPRAEIVETMASKRALKTVLPRS